MLTEFEPLARELRAARVPGLSAVVDVLGGNAER
jgi:hypothetical protein